MYPKKQLSSIG